MTSSETETQEKNGIAPNGEAEFEEEEIEEEDEFPYEVEMSLFDHLEELRRRIFLALIAVFVAAIACFAGAGPLVELLERPAGDATFLQLAPGEYFFVTLKVSGYGGLIFASPFVLYQIVRFVAPGLSVKERKYLGPVILGSSVLFFVGLVFAYFAVIPAALKFFLNYGAGIVDMKLSIARYFSFVLKLAFGVALCFQVPVLQLLLALLGIVSSQKMLSAWRTVIIGAAVAGAVLTPSADPVTQSLLGGAVLALYFSGIGLARLLGR